MLRDREECNRTNLDIITSLEFPRLSQFLRAPKHNREVEMPGAIRPAIMIGITSIILVLKNTQN